MHTEVKRFRTSDQSLAEKAFRIRDKVFVEEQDVDKDIEYDGLDDECMHYLLLSEGKAVATARWRETEKGIKLERFAVLKEYRNGGYGGLVLDEVLSDVLPLGKRIYLHSQDAAVRFYERHGFVKMGRPFLEANIWHFVMERPRSC